MTTFFNSFVFVIYVTSFIFSGYMINSIFFKKDFYKKTNLQKCLFILTIWISTIAIIDYNIERAFYPDNIFVINDFLHSFQLLVFIIGIASFIFSIYVVTSISRKSQGDKISTTEKVIFLPALSIPFIALLNLVVAGDIAPNITAEVIARDFSYLSTIGQVEKFNKQFLSRNIQTSFIKNYKTKYKEISTLRCLPDDFSLLEYRYKSGGIRKLDTCYVILSTQEIVDIDTSKATNTSESIRFRDRTFSLTLVKAILTSRFLGNYSRWVIDDLSYHSGQPYLLKDWLNTIQRMSKSSDNEN